MLYKPKFKTAKLIKKLLNSNRDTHALGYDLIMAFD